MTAVFHALTVGVPCREEGQDWDLFARGLREALLRLPAELATEVILCVNGSGEDLNDRLASVAECTGLNCFGVQIIGSEPGKLNAIRAVAKMRALQGYLAFIDSDVVLDASVLHRLWKRLNTDKACWIAYGQPVPVFPDRPNLIHQLCRVHYSLRDRVYKRPYFHGRAFMLRQWFFKEPRPLPPLSERLVQRLQLHQGPLVDDIAMSMMAIGR